ncbi:MAG: bifunctional DNA primase/polymerase [Nocardioidaceae bacterium]
MNRLLLAAIGAASRGWPVFPLTPGSKRPALHGETSCPGTRACRDGHQGWEQRATTDPDRIRACWGHDAYNIGLATGPAGLVVLDLDRPKPGQETPVGWDRPGIVDGHDTLAAVCEQADEPMPLDTYTVTTPTGGTHLYFRHPEHGPRLRNSTGMLGWLVDTRAEGGYVLAPGSVTTTGTYELVHDVPPAPLPGWLADKLAPASAPTPAPVVPLRLPDSRRARYLHGAITAQVAQIAETPEGGRNVAVYHSAVALGQLVAGGALNEDAVREALTRAGLQAGLRPTETDRTISSGLRAGTKRPRSVAA